MSNSDFYTCAWCARRFDTKRYYVETGEFFKRGWFCSAKCLSEAPPGIGELVRVPLCFITTAVCDELQLPDDCRELTTLRRFRDVHMLASSDGRELVERYYEFAPAMVAAIDAHETRSEIYRKLRTLYIEPAVLAVEAGDNHEAERIYTSMIGWLEDQLAGTSSRA